MRSAVRTLVTLLILLPAASALYGDSNADEADVRFRRGKALFKAGHYDEALAEFFASNRLVQNHRVVFNIAASYEMLGRYEEAYRYFNAYIVEEKNRDELAAAERRLRDIEPRVALLRVDSDPPGATVFLERKDLGGRGETPLLLAVSPGRKKVIVELKGHKAVSSKVEAVRGREVEVQVPLALIVGTLRVRSRPSAAVYVDRVVGDNNRPAALSTPTTLRLAPGRHSLEFEEPGYRTLRTDVVVRANREAPIDVALEERPPPSGTVVLASDTPGALVAVDGVESGFTPAVLRLVEGRHDVEVRGEGFRPWRRSIDVVKDGRSFYQVELEQAEAEVTGATRSPETLSTAPASVTLITGDEIWAFGYQTLTDAVRGVRGLYTSDDRNYEAIGVRGFSRPGDFTNRILLLRDGHAMNDDWIGSAAVGRDFAVDLDDVSRIEIVRGPGSTFYGPGAFFGVIQVVSEEPGRGTPVRAGGLLSSDGGGMVFARGAARNQLAAISLYASLFDSSGENLFFSEFADTPSAGEVRQADGEDAQRGGLRAKVGKFSFDASYARRRKDIPTASFETVFDPARNPGTNYEPEHTIDQRGYAEARWDHERGPLTIAARAAYDRQRYEGIYPYDDGMEPYLFSDFGSGEWLTGEVRLALTGWNQKLTLGAEVGQHDVVLSFDEDSDGTDEFRDQQDFTNTSGYAVEQISLFDERLLLSAGVRVDSFGESNQDALSPRLGLVFRPYESGFTKVVVGRAFRPPSLYELYYNDGGSTQVAPESLEPETIATADIEHTQLVGSRSFLIASLFASRIENIINLATNADDLLVYENSGDNVTTVGGELEARLTRRSGAWASVAASYTDLTSDDEVVKVNSVAAAASMRGFWPVVARRLELAGELVYNSRRATRDGGSGVPVLLGRVFASGRLQGGLTYRLGVTNVLDWDWSVPVGEEFVQQAIDQPGRTFHAQLVYQFE